MEKDLEAALEKEADVFIFAEKLNGRKTFKGGYRRPRKDVFIEGATWMYKQLQERQKLTDKPDQQRD